MFILLFLCRSFLQIRNMLTKTTFPQAGDDQVALLVGEIYLQVVGTLFLMLFFMKLSPKFGQVKDRKLIN